MRSIILIISFFFSFGVTIARQVTQEEMAKIYEQIKTPYKFGLVLVPQTNGYKIDCPTVFRKDGKWFMTYLVYNGKSGKDGRGYETWMATSENLLEWKTLGKILSFRDGTWDTNQRGGFLALQDMEWGGSYELEKYKNKYWMTYIGGASSGYEAGPLKLGMAFTKGDITRAHEWNSLDKPIMSPEDKDAQWFENITQYKSVIYHDKAKTLGKPFVMYYNAGGRHPETKVKAERIGIALSDNMKNWKRYEGNPIFTHEEGITGDAHIQKFGDLYVMFYFSAFRADRPYKAFNTFACSYDLVNWTDWQGADLIIPSKEYDNLFAHKSFVVEHEGVVYHYYCAVNKDDQRGIAVAVSKPMGRSAVRFPKPELSGKRSVESMNENWYTVLADTLQEGGQRVNIPHNWDDYYGYRQLVHGNLHGNAWYRKETVIADRGENKRYFLRFEGVGSYATVYVNGTSFGRRPAGRTTFTIDITDVVKVGQLNTIDVKAEHPAMIADMPWVCGGCSSEWGFSEGSQPLGIFRPVVLEVTDQVRVEPFGVHIWNDETANEKQATLHISTELKNYSNTTQTVEFISKFVNEDGIQVFRLAEKVTLKPNETRILKQTSPVIENPVLWDDQRAYLYRLNSIVKRDGKAVEETTTPFGIRTASWPVKRNDGDNRFLLNGKPVFLNGVCEYEHQFGQSHAFSDEQVRARVKQMKSAGFNAFRDAHQPHHLGYQTAWDESGIIWWTQFSAHIWYDTPEFRENFKTLLRQWVKERRNSPSLVIWGLQNESVLPKDFAEECVAIIREMDPTANNQRIITTCNGGDGTDWNVVQNWSGTYGGKPEEYNREIARQLLNGEYGAWRSIDLHGEGDYEQNGVWSEDRMNLLMEMKIRLAEEVRDSCCGQFQWIYSSHDNPGRKQPDECYRTLDKVGPFNYKGLVTPWEEPLDVYYMYRANYVSAEKSPMVYIVSHTWPGRWKEAGVKDGIRVFSNCDEVELFNGVRSRSLGRKTRKGIGTHFVWDQVPVNYNVLYAVGYLNGKEVAEDYIVLDHLPQSPDFEKLYQDVSPILKGKEDYNYLYRVNCGGAQYTDQFGQVWHADVARGKNDTYWGSASWAEKFEGLNPYLASQRRTFDPVKGTRDWPLFGYFRFGRSYLNYQFPLKDGRYQVELYFVEPWHGTGGGYAHDCEGLRIFDVAINDSVYCDDLDIWAEAGHDKALKKSYEVEVKGGILKIDFPEVKAGQALISAIAIASADSSLQAAKCDPKAGEPFAEKNMEYTVKTDHATLPEGVDPRPTVKYEAEQAVLNGKYIRKTHRKLDGIFFNKSARNQIEWTVSTGLAGVYALRFKYMNVSKEPKKVRIQLITSDDRVLRDDEIVFPVAGEKWRIVSTTTGSFINAGHYRVRISSDSMQELAFESLDVQ
ncbi:MAG: malectin domain-containing carbohydrate-binding protein [Bacteroidales bacterium]